MEHKLVICVTNINISKWMEQTLVIYVTNINTSKWMGTQTCDLCH